MSSGLRFRADGTFTVAQFTDLHWQDGGDEDRATSALVDAVLDAEGPDLAVFTGDVIGGGDSADPAAAWRGAVAPVVGRGLPWTFVFGNHDDEGSLSRAQLMEVARGCPGCLAEAGPAECSGVGNHCLDIASAAGSAAARLYLLDSGSYAPADTGGYAWIAPDQIEWYGRLARRAAAASGDPPPALAFFHIPLPEYALAWESGACVGERWESVCCPRVNSGLFAALRDAGEVLGVFVGHDHVNDYDGALDGIRLCYGRATGYHTYGREGFSRGARLIRLTEGRRGFDTWLRLDDGSRVVQRAGT